MRKKILSVFMAISVFLGLGYLYLVPVSADDDEHKNKTNFGQLVKAWREEKKDMTEDEWADFVLWQEEMARERWEEERWREEQGWNTVNAKEHWDDDQWEEEERWKASAHDRQFIEAMIRHHEEGISTIDSMHWDLKNDELKNFAQEQKVKMIGELGMLRSWLNDWF